MGNGLAVTQLDYFVGQQAQGPPGPAFRCLAASQGGDFGPLHTINFDGTARTRSILQTAQPGSLMGVAPSRHRHAGHAQGGGHGLQTLASVQFQQSGRPLDHPHFGNPTGQKILQLFLFDGAQLNMSAYHSIPYGRACPASMDLIYGVLGL